MTDDTIATEQQPKPCPFCGSLLERSSVLWRHPHADMNCLLASIGISDEQIAQWNTRAGAARQ